MLPFFFNVQMKCFYCPQQGTSVVLWDSLSPADQSWLWDKHPDAGEGAVCDSPRPSECPRECVARPQSSGYDMATHQPTQSRA